MSSSETDTTMVYLKCIKSQGKLRVRIITPGFYTHANCQFPRELREEGKIFRVHHENINLIQTRGKYYYSVKNKKWIEEVNVPPAYLLTPLSTNSFSNLKVYENEEQEECLICFDAPKEAVFNPCGHYYTCMKCSQQCKTCPICRQRVIAFISKGSMD